METSQVIHASRGPDTLTAPPRRAGALHHLSSHLTLRLTLPPEHLAVLLRYLPGEKVNLLIPRYLAQRQIRVSRCVPDTPQACPGKATTDPLAQLSSFPADAFRRPRPPDVVLVRPVDSSS
jgi:hypothetical protein